MPLAVTAKFPALKTVNAAALALVNCGGTGVFNGVTISAFDAGPAPAELVAVTVQVYWELLVNPPMEMGDTLLLPAPLGVQVALY